MGLDLVLLERIRNNEVVDLSISGGLSVKEISLLVEALPQCINLRSIQLSTNEIKDEGAKALAIALPKCTNLQSISIQDNNIREEGAKALAIALLQCTNLQHIELSYNKIGDAGAKALAIALLQCANLQSISIFCNNIGEEGAKALAIALLQCANLQSIYLGGNNIRDAGAKALAIALSQCPNLQNFDLWGNDIGAEGAKALAEVLQQCTNLQHINVSQNNIGAEGAKALAEVLSQCTNLQHINVRENYIGEEGAKALAIALTQCHNLYSFDILCNGINAKGEIAILSAIQENQYITDCYVRFHGSNQDNIDATCKANEERIKSVYQVTELDQSLQNEDFYKKLYTFPWLTRGIEDGVIPVAQVHALFQDKSIEQINLQEIRDQSISDRLKEHYTNPALSDQLPRLLTMLVEKNFYGYDAIPTIIECGHFTFAQDLIESSGRASCAKYFTSLIDAAPNPSDYRLLANVILSKIHDLHSNPYYMQEAVNKSKVTLVQSLIEHHASSEGVTTHQQGFSEDYVISELVGAFQEQEQLATMTGELSLEPDE